MKTFNGVPYEAKAAERLENWKCYLAIGLISIVVILLVSLLGFKAIKSTEMKIEDGHIVRNISDVIKELPKEPKDITDKIYEAQIPESIQKDIDLMWNSSEDLNIEYRSKKCWNRIIIEKGEEDNSIVVSAYAPDAYHLVDCFVTDISMYASKEGGIAVYGRKCASNNRYLNFFEVHDTGIEYHRGNLSERTIDIFGMNDTCDQIRAYNPDMTLIGKENNFMLYREGRKQGENEIFPGDDIAVFDNYYIMDFKHNLYYMYYSTSEEKPWIHFVKIAENVDRITNDLAMVEVIGNGAQSEVMQFVVYIKDGKRYTATPNDMSIEWRFGQHNGRNRSFSVDVETLDFTFHTVELSMEKSQKLQLHTKDDGYSQDDRFSWYAKCIYEERNYILYEDIRIRGLDSIISIELPEEEVNMLNGKTIKPDEYEEHVKILKELYAKYE